MKITIALAAILAPVAAFAGNFNDVPEIDALAGAAALAVVGGVVALVRERTKR